MRCYFLLLLLVLRGCSGAPAEPTSHYLALGDSYTHGESVSEADSYPFQLAAKLKAAGDDVGRPTVVAATGWTTDELWAGMDHVSLKPKYELVTLLIGVNNQFRRRGQDEFREQFTQLLYHAIRYAGGRPGHVVVISIPDWGVMPFAKGSDTQRIAREIDAFNGIALEESHKAGAAWVDVTPISRQASTQPSLRADDGLHPSAVQYGRWVEAMLPVMKKAYESRETVR